MWAEMMWRYQLLKNLNLLPPDLRDVVQEFRWQCGCGQEGLAISVTRKGTIQAHCFNCSQTIFWNDVQLFRFDDVFAFTSEKGVRKTTQHGAVTIWYPMSRVRIFNPSE